MQEAINSYVRSISPGDTVLFYYSGHAIGMDGDTHLAPIDVGASNKITTPEDVKAQFVSFTEIVDRLQHSNARVVIIIIDACRNNPLLNEKGSTRGLALNLQPPPIIHPPQGLFVLYAAGAAIYLGSRERDGKQGRQSSRAGQKGPSGGAFGVTEQGNNPAPRVLRRARWTRVPCRKVKIDRY
jgi:hypothetical protein